MSRMRLLLVTGMPGSGKTSISNFAKEKGFGTISMGDIIRYIAIQEGLEPTKRNLGLIAERVRRENGEAAVAYRCIEKMNNKKSYIVVIDGIRSLEEVEAFREAYGDAVLVAVHASPLTRFNRLRERGREDDPVEWETFLERDKRELGFGLGSAISMTDFMIINEDSLPSLKRAFTHFVECLKRG